MKIALIADIHSNLYAFDAVLKELGKESADLTISLGDIVYGGIYPRECLEKLYNINSLTNIKGNADALFENIENGNADNKPKYIIETNNWVKNQLTVEAIEGFRNFKPSEELTVNTYSLGFYHGSPTSYDDRIYDDDPEEDLKKHFDKTKHSVIAVAHTHMRMHRIFDDKMVINPGAIGIPRDLDKRAGYGILMIEKDRIEYFQKNVEYPVDSYIKDIRKSDLPYKESLIEQLQTAESNKHLFRPR